ncbi:fimbrial protein [Vibrio anguillarum]|uniref:fimbrial protein n=1 Tax=Vibrio anguillarum TaxID=55601 RepID=UPI0002E9E907|nr:fimbrial protein [Vibrio anguillarum]OEE49813.1 fimbrial protein [Vibrio anguillarum]
MKKTIIASAMMMLSASVFAAAAEDTGHGVVNFTGAIIDAPCSIAPESMDQTINMGLISNDLLEKQGETPVRPFSIHLESCSTETAKAATVTFSGRSDSVEKKNLAISGAGKGAAIALVNQLDDSVIELGTKTKAISIVEGDNVLQFGAKLVSNLKEGDKATPGEFKATTNFIISYE